jgi:hypothetical protein
MKKGLAHPKKPDFVVAKISNISITRHRTILLCDALKIEEGIELEVFIERVILF